MSAFGSKADMTVCGNPLTELPNDAPEFENQLLYVAKKWLILAALMEQLTSGADRAVHKFATRH